jgi:phosphoribosyl 1,2-cyclic phosphodiesterase
MIDAPTVKSDETPVRNLRIRFWGVQGSCPLFPEAHEVAEYERLAAVDLLGKVLRDVQEKSRNEGCKVEDLLGGPLTPANLELYQRKLGVSNLPVYGGDTTCVSIETGDNKLLILDGGSGIRNCSKYFVRHWPKDQPREISIFGTHEHLDHRSGLPFTQFCYVKPPFKLNVYGSFQFLHALDERYGVFSRQINPSTYLDDPIDYRMMAATFQATELRDFSSPPPKLDVSLNWAVRDVHEPIHVGKTTIHAFDVYHGLSRCLAYRIQHGPVTFVFCTDHETRHGSDASDIRQKKSDEAEARLVRESNEVDAAYFDGQYFRDEYEGRKAIGATMAISRLDWGHGCIEDVLDRARRCRIKRVFIGHHDPERTWAGRLEVDRWLTAQCAGSPYQVELAKSEDMLDL